MNRREVLINGFMAAGVAALVPVVARAQATGQSLETAIDIGTNHGHALVLSPEDALKLLRETRATGAVTLDIQGQSSHGHPLVLSHEILVDLFVSGRVSLVATGTSHDHDVTIKLDVV